VAAPNVQAVLSCGFAKLIPWPGKGSGAAEEQFALAFDLFGDIGAGFRHIGKFAAKDLATKRKVVGQRR